MFVIIIIIVIIVVIVVIVVVFVVVVIVVIVPISTYRVPAYSMGISGSSNAGTFFETFGKPGRPKNKQSKIVPVPPKYKSFIYGKDV